MRKLIIAIGIGVVTCSLLRAHEEPVAKNPSPEFDQVRKLAGKWTGTQVGKPDDKMAGPLTTEFKVTSAGSAVEETLGPGTPHEMVDMYVDEGGKLAMTHYCAMGNQPHMVLSKANAKSITLDMDKAPGVDAAKDPHMHTLILEMPDANHLTERWTSHKDGKAEETVVFNFTRTK